MAQPTESEAVAFSRAESLRRRLALLRERGREVTVVLPAEDGGDVFEKWHLKAPEWGAALDVELAVRERHREQFEKIAGFDAGDIDFEDMDSGERETVRIKTALGRIMTVEHIRLCVPELEGWTLGEIEAVMAHNGGPDGALASRADELCAAGGLLLGEDADPFGSPAPTDSQ